MKPAYKGFNAISTGGGCTALQHENDGIEILITDEMEIPTGDECSIGIYTDSDTGRNLKMHLQINWETKTIEVTETY